MGTQPIQRCQDTTFATQLILGAPVATGDPGMDVRAPRDNTTPGPLGEWEDQGMCTVLR